LQIIQAYRPSRRDNDDVDLNDEWNKFESEVRRMEIFAFKYILTGSRCGTHTFTTISTTTAAQRSRRFAR
jgi:hypothetical protein